MATKYNKVMIIDDNDFDIYLTSNMLTKNNISSEVIEFNSSILGLEYLTSHKNNLNELPQLIFLDIYMPRMTGFEFIDKLKDLGNTIASNCKICIVSSSVEDFNLNKSKIDEGNIIFTSKPITKEFINSL
tara:strand:- start:22 stop:411 length:390 start_codon:yes stop_codon:yes gene_type:complete